jgi:hypothetical protein
MGKAADNERIKLQATWLNNVSVGLAVAGVFVPYLAFVQNWTLGPDLPTRFHDWLYNPQIYFKVSAFVLALVSSRFYSHKARQQIAKIQD